MDFTFSEEHQMLRQAVRDFTDGAVRPLSAQIEREHHVPRELLDQLAELGLYGVAIPEEYGGAGMGETGLCIAMEEITRGDFSVAVTYGAHASIGAMSVTITSKSKSRLCSSTCVPMRIARLGRWARSGPGAARRRGSSST